MSTDPEELARLRASLEEVKAMWNPSLFGSTHAERMTFWKLGKERGWLRRRIEAAEWEERERMTDLIEMEESGEET